MQLINPFQKKEPSQEKLMRQQHDMSLQQESYASSLNPGAGEIQETENFYDRQNMMAELTRWQQDLTPMQKELFMNLAGLAEDNDGNLVDDPWNKAQCSYIAAKRFVNHIKPLDKNAMNGAWTIKQINDSMIWLDSTLRQDIIEHYKEFNIEYSTATFNYICNTIINAVYPTLLRGLENGERKHHGQIQKVIETKSLMPEKKKAGLFGKD